MNVRGPCSSCGAQLASDQRYCVECGQRVGPPLAMPYALPAASPQVPAANGRMLRLPIAPEMAGLFAVLALGFGVVLGTAISPNLAGIVAAPAPPVVAQAPPEPPASPSGTGGGGAPAPAPAASPATTVASSTSPTESSGGGGDGGGGGQDKKKKKKKPPAGIDFSGTVVRVNPVAQSYVVSTGTGLVAIHAETLPKAGNQVESTVRKLTNGTYAESGNRSLTGSADVASFQGTVTYCADLEQPSVKCDGSMPSSGHYVYAVSSLGASVLVTWPSSATNPPPTVGSKVQVGVHIGTAFQPVAPLDPADWTAYDDCNPAGNEQSGAPAQADTVPELTQTSLTPSGPSASVTLQGVVQTVCPSVAAGPGGLVLSADDIREAGRDLPALEVPGGIDPARVSRGQAVQVAVDVAGDGALSLKGITSDQGAAGADDASQGQGTLTGS
jgi:hypothetical protein